MSINLKIKIKSLAAEAKIIKNEERKFKCPKLLLDFDMCFNEGPDPVYTQASRNKRAKWKARAEEARQRTARVCSSLHTHRTTVVRNEARASFLAYGFLRGVPYHDVEGLRMKGNEHVTPPYRILKCAASIAQRFSDTREPHTAFYQQIQEWVQA